jgi:hypothetical protein
MLAEELLNSLIRKESYTKESKEEKNTIHGETCLIRNRKGRKPQPSSIRTPHH